MSEWREYKLEEIADIIGGGTPKTSTDEFWNGDIAWLTPRDLTGYSKTYIEKGERSITPIGLKKSSARLMPKGTVLLTSRAPIGYIAIASNEIATNQGFKSLVVKKNKALNIFIYYWLKNNIDYLKSNGTGTTFAEISGSVIKLLDILLPPLPEQKAIAEVLSSLDDKIDLLHRQNKTLEQMAETLFRQWFVEEAGEDWEYVALEEFVSCYNGVSYKSADLNPSETAMVTLKSFARDGEFRLDGFKEYTGKYKKTHIVKPGDLAVAHTDITQDAAIVGNPVLIIGKEEYTTLVVSMDLVKVESKKDWVSNEFIYFLMKTRLFKQHCLGYANGSTVLHLSKKAIPDFEFFLPPVEQIKLFTKQAQNLLGKKNKNIYQIRTLEKLRDTLLPKLMSGEVRVN